VHRGSVKLQFSLGVAGMSAYFSAIQRENRMKIKVIVHEADEGGFWAEVPAIPGCATQARRWMSFCATCMRPSRVAFPWTSRRPSQAVNSAS
jgi:hypothetical protein